MINLFGLQNTIFIFAIPSPTIFQTTIFISRFTSLRAITICFRMKTVGSTWKPIFWYKKLLRKSAEMCFYFRNAPASAKIFTSLGYGFKMPCQAPRLPWHFSHTMAYLLKIGKKQILPNFIFVRFRL